MQEIGKLVLFVGIGAAAFAAARTSAARLGLPALIVPALGVALTALARKVA